MFCDSVTLLAGHASFTKQEQDDEGSITPPLPMPEEESETPPLEEPEAVRLSRETEAKDLRCMPHATYSYIDYRHYRLI